MTQQQQLPSWKPRSYQETAVRLGVQQACAGFLLRPGMGKTTICYAIVKILKPRNLMRRALVIAPRRVIYSVWPKQKDAWAEFADLKVNVLHGKHRVQAFKDLSADIYCITPEGLEWLLADAALVAWLRAHFDVLIVDESTKFKNTGTQRFKRLRTMIPYFKRRYILTGSFTPNGLLDLFGQIYILDEGGALGRYISHYKAKYFYPTDYMGYNLAPHAWAMEEIARKINPLTLVLERAGNLQMPELLFNDIKVALPADARSRYSQMEHDMLTTLDNAALVVAANAAVATSKCRQIANGFVFGNDGAWTDLHSAKIEALLDLIDQLNGESALIIYEFMPDLEKLKKALPTAISLTGNSAAVDARNIELFSGGFVQLALGQVSSISLGIDGLQNKCSNVIMYGITWNLQDYSQTIDRVWRQGQRADTVVVHRLLAEDTVDERVLAVLNNKESTQTSFLQLLNRMKNETVA